MPRSEEVTDKCHDNRPAECPELPLNGEGDPLIDTIANGQDVEEMVIEKDQSEMLRKKLGHFRRQINEKESFILDNRIMAEDPLTLREIGQRFNSSRDSVRQIRAKISKKLVTNLKSTDIRPPV